MRYIGLRFRSSSNDRLIPDLSNLPDFDFDHISVLEPRGWFRESRHPGRSPRHHDGALSQRRSATQMLEDLRYRGQQATRVGVLTFFSIHRRFQVETGVGDLRRRDNHRADGPKLVKGLCIAMLTAGPLGHLPVSRGNVVAHGGPESIVLDAVLGTTAVPHVLADDEGQLPFMVEDLAGGVNVDVVIWAREGAYNPLLIRFETGKIRLDGQFTWRLGEDGRKWRYILFGFGYVSLVVQPDAVEDGRGGQWAQNLFCTTAIVSQRIHFEKASFADPDTNIPRRPRLVRPTVQVRKEKCHCRF